MFHPIVMAFDIEIRLDQATQRIDLLTYVLSLKNAYYVRLDSIGLLIFLMFSK